MVGFGFIQTSRQVEALYGLFLLVSEPQSCRRHTFEPFPHVRTTNLQQWSRTRGSVGYFMWENNHFSWHHQTGAAAAPVSRPQSTSTHSLGDEAAEELLSRWLSPLS